MFLPNSTPMFLPSFGPFVRLYPQSFLARFHGVADEKISQVFLEFAKEDKGAKFAFGGFKFPPPVDAKDTEVSPLHVIFNLKGVLIGKDYFIINHLLSPLFNLVWGCTSLGKNIVPRSNLKEFLLRCLQQFTIYIWMFNKLGKMNTYLRKIVEDTCIEINPQRIIDQDLCKINKCFL